MTIQQHTIDIGIDLGTSNSTLAVVVDGQPRIVPNKGLRPITPSVVRVRANGALDVGDGAYQQLEFNPQDTYGEFKRAMGDSSARYHFQASGRQMTPPELSSEVLKTLRADFQLHHGFVPRAAVITVPAAFGLAQCAATQEAATLAGFEQAPLLQEPVAASLAYGYSVDASAGNWLVYDLGGGTFDLALVGIRDGRIHVIDHEGDNFLGGKDFDWLIVERILVPRLAEQYDMRSFRRSRPERRSVMALLKTKAEEVKVALSTSSAATATIESGRVALLDDAGEEVSADVNVTRAEYEALITDTIETTIELCRKVLARNPTVRPESVLLVGGPTLTPYLRRKVAEELGIPVETSANPMTVVAEGAALFAATQPLGLGGASPSSLTPSEPDEASVAVELRYTTVTDDSEIPLGLRVASAEAASVEIATRDGSWRSGSLPLRAGSAVLRVPIATRGENAFVIQLMTPAGELLSSSPASFTVTRGLTAAASPLSRSLGVVVREEGSGRKSVEWLLRHGTALPASATYEFRTTIALEPGGEVEIIGIYLVEGEARRPDRNHLVGTLEITDRQVSRLVPAGAPVEVTIDMSASRLLKANAFLPSIDQTFELEIQFENEHVTPAELARTTLEERDRIESMTAYLSGDEVARFNREAERVAAAGRSVSADDPGSEQQALAALKTLRAQLDDVDARADLPRAVDEGRHVLAKAGHTLTTMGSESQQRRFESLRRELESASNLGDLAEVERTTSKIRRLEFEVLAAQSWFWTDWFNYFATTSIAWRDPAEADRLVRAGTNAIQAGDNSALRRATIGLSALAPGEQGSFDNTGLRR